MKNIIYITWVTTYSFEAFYFIYNKLLSLIPLPLSLSPPLIFLSLQGYHLHVKQEIKIYSNKTETDSQKTN